MEGADTTTYTGEGPPRWNAGRGLAPEELSSSPRERSLLRVGAVLGSLNTRFFRGNRSREGQVIFF